MLRHRGHLPEPEMSLWEVIFWWLPDLDDEDEEEDDDEEIKRRKSKRVVTTRTSRGFRNRPMPEKKLLKQRDGKLKDRRTRKAKANRIKDKRGRMKKEDPEEATDKDDERDETEPKNMLEDEE
ncbi:PREDICTED: nucleolin-like [Cyprinodon variegatus]|uniref:nucleolin-like n=2 Tax=Cyprinodon TaxID=28741 RepID=UPI000742742F|nr:PREDICTED: nucleolin-like [Cyprinodon variegatus]